MDKILFSLFLIFSGLTAGYFFNTAAESSRIKLKVPIISITKFLQSAVIMGIMPIPVFLSMWVADLRHTEIMALPILGAAALLLGGFIAYIISKPLGLSREQQGVFTVAGGFTNIGAIGGLISFLLLGEKGFALVAIYQITEKFIYFPIGFPFAKSRSKHHTRGRSTKEKFIDTLIDPVIIIYLTAICLGAFFNLTEIKRPDIFYYLSSILIPIGAFLLLFSIGFSIRFSKMKKYIIPGIIIFLIKSLIVPVVIFTIGYYLGLGDFSNGIALKMLLILSAMPVAFIAIVPATLYDMDIDLANTCWFLSTAGMIIVIPLLFKIVPLI